MKRIATLIGLLFIILGLSAQRTKEELGGVYYAYPAPKEVKAADAPAGYRLVYISHYGRHGSRWLTNDARYEWVLKYFNDDNNLTRQGRKVRQLMQRVYANAKGNGGLLTPVGERQHRGIARRMTKRFSDFFSGDTISVRAQSSVFSRCRKSMEAFDDELKKTYSNVDISAVSDSADMDWITCSLPAEKLLKNDPPVPFNVSADRFISLLFKDPSKVAEPTNFLSEMLTVASDMQDIDGLNVDLYHLFTREEMEAYYEKNCRSMWHQHGPDPTSHGIPALCAASLWKHIADDADKALTSGRSCISLRFGHDSALYRLLTLLHADIVGDASNLCSIVPMGANLQMAFYRNEADSVVVCFWLNERPMTLHGVASLPASYGGSCKAYPWGELKAAIGRLLNDRKWHDRVRSINTMVGTDVFSTKSASIYVRETEGHGQTLPAVLSPHGQTFWTPQTRATEKKCIAPYYYSDSLFQGFRASHWMVGGCTQDYGSFTVMPEMDSLRKDADERATHFSHDDETAHPNYYSVTLPDEHLRAEMTGASHTVLFRFTPSKSGTMHIVIQANSDTGEGFVSVDTLRNCIWGYNPVHRIYQGWGEKAGFNGWFVMELNRKFTSYDATGKSMAAVSFSVSKDEKVMARAATSFTGIEGAWKNLRREQPDWDFTGAVMRLDSIWRCQLSKIDIEDSNTRKVNALYGAFYRSSFLPREMSDVDGCYPKFANGTTMTPPATDRDRRKYYDDFSMWDIYRAELPLLTLTDTLLQADLMQSLVKKYGEGGWMPIFPCWNSYTAAMIGDHAAAALADAWVKGVKGFDIRKAYEGVRKNAFEHPKTFEEYNNGMGRRALESYLRYGFIPLEDNVKEAFHTKEQVSRTMEYAYDDFCAAQLAKAAGAADDYNVLMKRSRNWLNAINPKTGWADGRHKNGRWLGNNDLKSRVPFITEGSVMHYSFYVPHDVEGLMKVMGGRKCFLAKLDTLFAGHYYWHGNEPCHQIAYLYALAGQPRKTQEIVREILKSEYNDTPGGLSGNDDAGQMSAWYVFSSLGFYPLCPGKPEYVLGVPSFSKIRIGKLTIETVLPTEDDYASQVLWNGKPYTMPVITHDMIRQGGTLTFK